MCPLEGLEDTPLASVSHKYIKKVLIFQETHIMWKYDEEFYGKWLKLLICGYIRPEKNYDSLRKYNVDFL